MPAEESLLAMSYAQRLALLSGDAELATLRGIRRGIEKESLRVDADGRLALTPHPAGFGSALCHPSITTDFSEALLEFITGVNTDIDACLAELEAVHRFARSELGEETLWNASMPAILGERDEDIPVARYGSSNPAIMKTRYRLGLGHRYGRKMQTIAGIHYNFSLPEALWQSLHQAEGSELSLQDFITEGYFSLIRNFRRHAWLLIYLFGAAPAVSRCFLNGRSHQLDQWDEHTLYGEHATSLRMGDLGYQSDAQKGLFVCYNQLENYIQTLLGAITTAHPAYQGIPAGEQLSPGLLQIENEFYSPIRPKRVTGSGETPLGALRSGGVEYIEVRCLDVNPMLPLGIDAEQIRFLDAFLLHCLCADSPACDHADNDQIIDNILQVVNRGREPGLRLRHNGGDRALSEWADELMTGIADISGLLDRAHGGSAYRDSHATQGKKLNDPALTPAAQMLASMARDGESFFEFALSHSRRHAEAMRQRGISAEEAAAFAQLRDESATAQRGMESVSQESFDDYLAGFYAQYAAL